MKRITTSFVLGVLLMLGIVSPAFATNQQKNTTISCTRNAISKRIATLNVAKKITDATEKTKTLRNANIQFIADMKACRANTN